MIQRISIAWRVLLLAALLPVASTVSQAAVLCAHVGESNTNHLGFVHEAEGCDEIPAESCDSVDPLTGEHPPCQDVQLEIDQVRPDQGEAVELPSADTFEWTFPAVLSSPNPARIYPGHAEERSVLCSAGLRTVQAVRFNL